MVPVKLLRCLTVVSYLTKLPDKNPLQGQRGFSENYMEMLMLFYRFMR